MAKSKRRNSKRAAKSTTTKPVQQPSAKPVETQVQELVAEQQQPAEAPLDTPAEQSESTVETPTVEQENTNQTQPTAQQTDVKYSNSGGLSNLLQNLKLSITFTSYQSNLMYFIGSWPGQLNIHQTAIDKPMGIFVSDKNTIHLASGYAVTSFRNVLDEGQFLNGKFDGCYLPRNIQLTGILDAHDIGVTENNEIVFVSTRFNCLATYCERHSFKPYWTPPFINQIIDEDRCHLNGMAMQDGKVKYVTAVSKSNTIDGWRDRRSNGGIVIDVETNKIVCEGLSMPHSPRVHDGKLWLLNSGTGALGYVDFDKKGKGKFVEVVFCPGFVRGLSFHNNYAFVGLSKPRYERFEGLELDKRLTDADSEPWCGVQVIDLNKGSCVEWFRIDGAVAELYDLNLIQDINMPMAMAPGSADANTLITLDPQFTSANANIDADADADVDVDSDESNTSNKE